MNLADFSDDVMDIIRKQLGNTLEGTITQLRLHQVLRTKVMFHTRTKDGHPVFEIDASTLHNLCVRDFIWVYDLDQARGDCWHKCTNGPQHLKEHSCNFTKCYKDTYSGKYIFLYDSVWYRSSFEPTRERRDRIQKPSSAPRCRDLILDDRRRSRSKDNLNTKEQQLVTQMLKSLAYHLHQEHLHSNMQHVRGISFTDVHVNETAMECITYLVFRYSMKVVHFFECEVADVSQLLLRGTTLQTFDYHKCKSHLSLSELHCMSSLLLEKRLCFVRLESSILSHHFFLIHAMKHCDTLQHVYINLCLCHYKTLECMQIGKLLVNLPDTISVCTGLSDKIMRFLHEVKGFSPATMWLTKEELQTCIKLPDLKDIDDSQQFHHTRALLKTTSQRTSTRLQRLKYPVRRLIAEMK